MTRLLVFCCFFVTTSAADGLDILLRAAEMTAGEAQGIGRTTVASAHNAFLAQRQVGHDTPGCLRCAEKRYDELCPLQWTYAGGGRCVAPESYKGDCASTQVVTGLAAWQKQSLEAACALCWPCLDDPECPRNWAQPCPLGYAPTALAVEDFGRAAGITCQADAEVSGQCETILSFAGIADKTNFAKRCASWPCQTSCGDVGYDDCPINWTPVGNGFCAAPAYYKVGGCSLLQNFQGWTSDMKLTTGADCQLAWRCASAKLLPNGPPDDATCEQVATEGCPLFWSALGDGFCMPPVGYTGPCAEATNFSGMQYPEKLRWATKCLQNWPCVSSGSTRQHTPVAPFMGVHLKNGALGGSDAA